MEDMSKSRHLKVKVTLKGQKDHGKEYSCPCNCMAYKNSDKIVLTWHTHFMSELTFTLGTDTSANGTSMRISGGTASTSDTGQIVVDIPNYASTAVWKFMSASGYSTPGSGAATPRSAFISGIFINTAAISSIQILTSSASFNAGTYVLYGVK